VGFVIVRVDCISGSCCIVIMVVDRLCHVVDGWNALQIRDSSLVRIDIASLEISFGTK
jgi:hypothetical protein